MSSPGKKRKKADKAGPGRKRSGGHGREQADEALRQQLWLAETLLDSIPLPVFYKDVRGRYLGCNRAFAGFLGKPQDQIIGRTDFEVAPRDLAETYRRADEELLRRTGTQAYEAVVESGDGTRHDVFFTKATFTNPDGTAAGIVGTINDITERKALWLELEHARAELESRVRERTRELEEANRVLKREVEEHQRTIKALRSSEERFKKLFENASVAIFMADAASGLILACNAKAEDLIGRQRDEIIGMHQSQLHPPEEEKRYRAQFRKDAQLPNVTDQESVVLRKDGRVVPVIISATSVTVDGKGVVIGFFLDITGRKQAEQALRDAKARAELYLDLMGHDICNMNQAMLGYLELAQDMIDLKGHEELIGRPLEIIRHSTRLIDSVKKLEQAQSGRYPLKRVDLCSVLAGVVAGYAQVPGREVGINYAPRKGCMVRASDLLSYVFDNLIGNAIRHSEGPLTVDVSVDGVREGDREYYRVSVADNGPGIPEEMKKKIFTFVQTATGKASRRGLGLYMARTLVASYGGRLWAEDRVPGDFRKGARFIVTLPAA